MPDAIFNHPRLAAIYDALDPDRSDLDVYAAMVTEFGAHSILDIGCGTGTFACMLAGRGLDVAGVDPARASLDVARQKAGADRVRWIHGTATEVLGEAPDLAADLAMMTGNVAQVFLTDEDWSDTLHAAHDILRPGGRLVFETRDPARRAWEQWTREHSFQRADIDGVGVVEHWVQVNDVSLPFVTFESLRHFLATGEAVVSTSTLRFRERDEIDAALIAAGFEVIEIREAPDRPGKEFVYVAERPA